MGLFRERVADGRKFPGQGPGGIVHVEWDGAGWDADHIEHECRFGYCRSARGVRSDTVNRRAYPDRACGRRSSATSIERQCCGDEDVDSIDVGVGDSAMERVVGS